MRRINEEDKGPTGTLVLEPVNTRRMRRRIYNEDRGPTGYLYRNLSTPGRRGGVYTMRTEDSQDTRPETCQHHEEDEEDTWREYRTHRILVQKPVSTM